MAKIGEGHAAAMARLGLTELRNALYNSNESVADSEIGLYGTRTQGEIADARGDAGQQETVSLDDLRGKGQEAQQAEQKLGKDGPDMGRQHGRGV